MVNGYASASQLMVVVGLTPSSLDHGDTGAWELVVGEQKPRRSDRVGFAQQKISTTSQSQHMGLSIAMVVPGSTH